MFIPKYLPEITVFVCGGIFMIFELVGSRVLGPYFGTSLYVWTNLIGIFLGSLSVGYYLGGKLADRFPKPSMLGYLVFLAGVFISFTLLIKDPLLSVVAKYVASPGLGSAIASLILFLPPSLILGTISPLAGKLKITSLNHTGSSLGTLYALSTVGSIIGTYLAGYWLIPTFGTNKLILLLSITLLSLSLLISLSHHHLKIMALVLALLGWPLLGAHHNLLQTRNFLDVDTPYNRVWIFEGYGQTSDRPVRVMGINAENHSSIYLDSDELANTYTQYFHLVSHFVPGFSHTLMLGGAGYSYPQAYLREYPTATIDVVEIDPMVTDLARQYFNLQDDPRLTIIHQDARVFLNQSSSKYDAVFGDVFSSRYAPPFHLTSIEAMQAISSQLNDGGVFILNLISGLEGDKATYFVAQYHTLQAVFPHVSIFAVEQKPRDQIQNIILVASHSPSPPQLVSQDPQMNKLLESHYATPITRQLPVLTDDYAPIESYLHQLI